MNQEWVVLCSTNGNVEGCIVKSKLESEGVPVVLKQEAIGKFYTLTVDGLGETKVLVPRSCLEKARKILSSSEKIPAGKKRQRDGRRR